MFVSVEEVSVEEVLVSSVFVSCSGVMSVLSFPVNVDVEDVDDVVPDPVEILVAVSGDVVFWSVTVASAPAFFSASRSNDVWFVFAADDLEVAGVFLSSTSLSVPVF